MVENCESNSIYFLNKDLETLNKTQKTLQDKVSKNAIAIRILDTDINIENILKLVEYAILNRIEIVKNNEEYIDADYPNSINKFSYLGLKKEKVNEINNSNTSETILNLLKEKTFFIKTDNISGYYLNNSYYFSNKLTSFSTNSLEYLIKNNNNFYVFTSKKHFIFLSNSSKEKIIHSLNFEGNFPFNISNYNYISKEKVKNGVYISFHRSNNAFTFSEDKNEIISYFKN